MTATAIDGIVAALRCWRACLIAGALLLSAALPCAAHDVPGELRIHAFVRAEGERLHMVVRIPLALLLNIDLPKRGDGYLDLQHVDEAFPRALAATTKGIELLENGTPLVPMRGDARISLPSDKSFQTHQQALASVRGAKLPAATDVYWNQGYFDAVLEYAIRSDQGPFAIDFRVSPGLKDRLKLDLRLVARDGVVRAFELPTDRGPVVLDPRWYQAAASFVGSGFHHILGGADHLLFLLCLIVPFRRLGWHLVGVITAFTAAHSVTLIAAAYGWVPRGNWFPPAVETLIALSILYMAIENVVHPNLQWRWLLTALFGLVHGFGFSFALTSELQFAGSHLLLSLLAFNVGIEIGQLLVLLLLWPVLSLVWSRVPAGDRAVTAIISAFVAHTAWHWTTERWQALMKTDLSAFDAAALAPVVTAVLLALVAAWVMRWPARRGSVRQEDLHRVAGPGG